MSYDNGDLISREADDLISRLQEWTVDPIFGEPMQDSVLTLVTAGDLRAVVSHLRALPSAQHTVEVERLRETLFGVVTERNNEQARADMDEAALAAMTENAKALAKALEGLIAHCGSSQMGCSTWDEEVVLAHHNKMMEGK